MLKFSLKFQINVTGKIIGYLRSSAKLNDTAGQNNGNNGLKKVPVAILQISAMCVDEFSPCVHAESLIETIFQLDLVACI